MWNASFKLTLFGCVISICCVGFASLDVVCDELNDCNDSMGLYEVPFSVSLLGFGIGTMLANFHV